MKVFQCDAINGYPRWLVMTSYQVLEKGSGRNDRYGRIGLLQTRVKSGCALSSYLLAYVLMVCLAVSSPMGMRMCP